MAARRHDAPAAARRQEGPREDSEMTRSGGYPMLPGESVGAYAWFGRWRNMISLTGVACVC